MSKNNKIKNADYNIESNATITLKGLKDIGVDKNTKDFDRRVALLKAYAKEVGLSIWTDEPIDMPKTEVIEDDDDYTRR